MTITKEDIGRLKVMRDAIAYDISTNPKCSFDNGDLVALNHAIAQLTQPYQWGEEVRVDTGQAATYLCINPHDTTCSWVQFDTSCVGSYDNDLIRPVKQTVQVTPEMEAMEASVKELVNAFDKFKAIAQEGEE